MKFSEVNIDKKILKGLAAMGFEEMTPIQELTIPVLAEGSDVIGQAQTGTGKTAAFGVPMLERMDPNADGVQGLILCPTRELAVQASEELHKMAKYTHGIKIVPVYGGQDISRQIRALKGRVSIVVGTPGRVMDHMRRKTLKLENVSMLVLDEADEMLNMGFREDIETICESLPEDRQTALFSATMPDEILEITDEYQRDAVHLRVKNKELTIPLIKQYYYVVKGREKDTSLCRLLDYTAPERAVIFCNTKRKVDELTLMLKRKGYSAEALHGDLSQHQRDRVMNLFKGGRLELLLATDVAARGIDVDDIDLVFNYDMPQDMEYYVHRIGRTGRAGKSGKAVSLITSGEKYKIDSLEDYCNTRISRKEIPTAESALWARAYRNVDNAVAFCSEMDLTEYMKVVYKRCVDYDMDPLEVAAAFLRMNLGDVEELRSEEDERRGRGRDNRRRRDRKNNSYRDRKDSDNRKNKKKAKKDKGSDGQYGGKASRPSKQKKNKRKKDR